MKDHTWERFLLVLFSGLLTVTTLSGCSEEDLMGMIAEYTPEVIASETVSDDSQWINSAIDGSIDASTAVRAQDDFYTYVNKDWQLEHTLSEETPSFDFTTDSSSLIMERLTSLMFNKEDPDMLVNNELPTLSTVQTEHNRKLVQNLTALAADEEGREEAGAEPIRPYLDAIDSIASLDELTSYLKNEDGTNFTLIFPVPMSVGTSLAKADAYTVILSNAPELVLGESDQYKMMFAEGINTKNRSIQQVQYLMQQLGYSESEINQTIQNCFDLEIALTKGIEVSDYFDAEQLIKRHQNYLTFDELADYQGNYPLQQLLACYGMDQSSSYEVWELNYLKTVGKLYTEKNLALFKAYYTVHTILSAMPLLDQECRALTLTEEESNDEEIQNLLVYSEYIAGMLNGPMEQLYAASYCTEEEKEALEDLTEKIRDSYDTILDEADWMSDETRSEAKKKLDQMVTRVLYPDVFLDYTSLDFGGKGECTLLDAKASINAFNMTAYNHWINQTVDRTYWDLETIGTTTVNAYYIPTDNSINILAGIIADGSTYDADASFERNLGSLGMIIGHEISHGFDNSGSLYDEYGNKNDWWTFNDRTAFSLRVDRLKKFYNVQPLTRGYTDSSYGDTVAGEAIADMGGIRSTLLVAKTIPDFDYEEFFTAYAGLWREKMSYVDFYSSVSEDPHPANFLRTNVTLQQFDEFIDTFHIKPSDGMYLAKEDRIAVW